MLVGNDPHGFKIIPILPLAGGLLELFVRNAKPRELVADTEAKAVAVGKISLVTDGEITRSASVRIVLNNGRIQIAIGPITAGAGTQCVFSPGVLDPGIGGHRIKAAARKNRLAMQAQASVCGGVHFDDAAHLSPILGRNVRRVDAQGLNIVRFYFRAKAGRAIVREGNAVNDKLGLVFGAARMQNGVALIEPSGLRTDEILQRTARQGCRSILDAFRADSINRTGATRIDQRVRVFDLHSSIHRSQPELDRVLVGKSGANFDRVRKWDETLMPQFYSVHPKGQVRYDKMTRLIGDKCFAKLIRLAHQFNRGLHAQAFGIGDLEAYFSRIALAEDRGGKNQKRCKFLHRVLDLLTQATSRTS